MEYLYIIIPIAVLLAILLTLFLLLKARKQITDSDILGKKCIVTVEVNNFAGRGQVRIGNQSWSCRTLFDEDLYEVGESVVVVAIEGAKLVCKKA